MADKIRVLLADDHPMVRVGIRTILAREQDLVLVGEAGNGHSAQRLSQELRPDVLLLDLSMPGPPATETVGYLREHCPEVRVLVLTAYEDDVYVSSLVRAGVTGYVLKDETADALVRAIRSVMQGDTWFSRSVAQKLARLEPDEVPAMSVSLTGRERQILALVARGWDNARIASESGLAEQTVCNYISRVYSKLGASSRAEAVVWAREHGIV